MIDWKGGISCQIKKIIDLVVFKKPVKLNFLQYYSNDLLSEIIRFFYCDEDVQYTMEFFNINKNDYKEIGSYIINCDAYNQYLNSELWEINKNPVILRSNNICEVLNCVKLIENVHHLTYERKYKELPYDLLGLCRCHHRMLHFSKYYSLIASQGDRVIKLTPGKFEEHHQKQLILF